MAQGTEHRNLIIAGSGLAALGVACGAFGAHGLRHVLDPAAMGWWQTAVQYQMWQAIGLLALAASPLRRMALPGALLALGTIIFSAALYAMALTGLRWLGAVAPIGGALMIAGWLCGAWRAWRS